jgi:hypothetical protein
MYELLDETPLWGSLDINILWSDWELLCDASDNEFVSEEVFDKYFNRLHFSLTNAVHRVPLPPKEDGGKRHSQFYFEPVEFPKSFKLDRNCCCLYEKVTLLDILAARKISRVVKDKLYDPKSVLCQKRMKREFDYLEDNNIYKKIKRTFL